MGVFMVAGARAIPRWAQYGATRADGHLGPQVPHAGVDVPSKPGSTVQAWGPCVVRDQRQGNQGYHVLLEYEDYWVWYLHLDRKHHDTGARLKRGDVIGRIAPQEVFERVGMMPPHTHLQAWRKSTQPNPPGLPLTSIIGTVHPNEAFESMRPSDDGERLPPDGNRPGFPYDGVVVTSANFRATPKKADNIRGVLPANSPVRVLEQVHGWLLVERKTNGARGFVSSELVRRA